MSGGSRDDVVLGGVNVHGADSVQVSAHGCTALRVDPQDQVRLSVVES